ncbi:HAMP domain-containing histidine kinase [Dyadobacter chenwenxiniae]|uniref:histidine kinase n=1 Tax=Dyadobacter chenwenxiniae TaxID=2906456 RepID=A0A9X1PVB9_9BACT|nr:tetratricopeptide repeat-containing sensor histidine kinase [Dyadobacter chenwenxiniae]MCF0065751.1 HAMP domain-containing histidine kinase [Dyadobacter chenwenxiniae]UON84123.1 HAMP domain-containing histidine kinase [Dyadobacter chenwenxiniae]
MKTRFIFFLLLGVVCNAFGQKQGKELVDSLIARIPNVRNDSLKVRLFKQISDEYFYIDVEQALVYSKAGLKLADKIKWKRAIGAFNLNIGRAYSDKGSYDSCMYFYNKAYDIHRQADDKVNMASLLNNMGAAEQNLKSNDTKAANYYFKALKISEELKDDYLTALCYDNISQIYFSQSNYSKALDFGFKSLRLYQGNLNGQSGNDQRNVGNAFAKIAAIYTDINEAQKAKLYYDQAIPLLEKSGDLEGMAKAYSNMSILAGKDFASKLDYGLKAEKLWNQVNPMHLLAVHNVGSMGIAFQEVAHSDSLSKLGYSRSQLADLAKVYLTKAIRLSEQTGEISSRAHFTGALAEIQAETGDYKNAYLNFRLYQHVQDSLYSQENKNRIAGLQGKREIELRDKQIRINALELENQRKQRLGLAVGLLLLTLAGGLFYRQSLSRKRANVQLLRLNAELDEANKVKARFFAILSHDLRSPIANLINFLHLQKEEPGMLTAQLAEMHQKRITASVEGLLENMESMLLWSKGQMTNFKPQAKSVLVSGLFEYIEKFFAAEPNVAFSFSSPGALVVVSDEDYLKTILQNLTINAVKALKNVPDAHIRWEAEEQGMEVMLTITDNGPGASAQQLRALFNDDTEIGVKTGLGLHLIRDLSKAIGCKITVKSEPGAGTAFQLTVPDLS